VRGGDLRHGIHEVRVCVWEMVGPREGSLSSLSIPLFWGVAPLILHGVLFVCREKKRFLEVDSDCVCTCEYNVSFGSVVGISSFKHNIWRILLLPAPYAPCATSTSCQLSLRRSVTCEIHRRCMHRRTHNYACVCHDDHHQLGGFLVARFGVQQDPGVDRLAHSPCATLILFFPARLTGVCLIKDLCSRYTIASTRAKQLTTTLLYAIKHMTRIE
jgi:hypothetical protein